MTDNGFPKDDDDEVVDNSLGDDDLIPRPDPKVWKPSLADPFPTFQCTYTKPDGTRCIERGITGMLPENAKCSSHGGKAPSVKDKARARVEAARMKIFDDAPHAAEVLQSLTLEGTADNIRLKAATEILDRAGIRGGVEIDLSGEVQVNTAEQVRERLAKLAMGRGAIEPDEDEDEDIIDAEVEEEPVEGVAESDESFEDDTDR